VRFLSPIGSDEERRSLIVPPGKWSDATGYARYYQIKPGVTNIHTGNDWNLNYPGFDADAHSKVYAIGPGVVIYARVWPNPGAWGNIIVIDHGIVDGLPCFSRYAHVEHMLVVEGQAVDEWTHIANVGNGNGIFAYHLHFDISLTNHLKLHAGDWPGTRMDLVKLNYTDPVPWLRREHTINVSPIPTVPTPTPGPAEGQKLRVIIDSLKLRSDHRTNAPILGRYPRGTEVLAFDVWESPLYRWRAVEVSGKKGWMCERENQEFYLAEKMPPIKVVALTALNIRKVPDIFAEKLGQLARNETTYIVSYTETNGYVELAGGGWVLFSYLEEV
jgi:hypothetical protein